MNRPIAWIRRLVLPAVVIAAGVVYAITRPYSGPVHLPSPSQPSVRSIAVVTPSPDWSSVRGRVVWEGELPVIEPIFGLIHQPKSTSPANPPRWQSIPNPHRPSIHPSNRGIANVVVYLKSATITQQKPWPYPPLRVVSSDSMMRLFQGPAESPIGLVKQGDEVEFASECIGYEAIRVRGGAFLTIPMTPRCPPVKRSMTQSGPVRLTSAMVQEYKSADFWVCDHAYYTVTNSDGEFQLDQVPPGEYELVTWLRHWRVTSQDRDPETSKLTRIHFAEPISSSDPIRVITGQVLQKTITISGR